MDLEYHTLEDGARLAVEHQDATGHGMTRVHCPDCDELLGFRCVEGCGRVAVSGHGLFCGW